MGREDEIRIIAYSMWEQEGCRDGHDCEHWLKAEIIWEQNQKTGTASKTKSEPPKKTGTLGTREKNKATGRKF